MPPYERSVPGTRGCGPIAILKIRTNSQRHPCRVNRGGSTQRVAWRSRHPSSVGSGARTIRGAVGETTRLRSAGSTFRRQRVPTRASRRRCRPARSAGRAGSRRRTTTRRSMTLSSKRPARGWAMLAVIAVGAAWPPPPLDRPRSGSLATLRTAVRSASPCRSGIGRFWDSCPYARGRAGSVGATSPRSAPCKSRRVSPTTNTAIASRPVSACQPLARRGHRNGDSSASGSRAAAVVANGSTTMPAREGPPNGPRDVSLRTPHRHAKDHPANALTTRLL